MSKMFKKAQNYLSQKKKLQPNFANAYQTYSTPTPGTYQAFGGGGSGGAGGSIYSTWSTSSVGDINGVDISVAINCAPREIRVAIQGKMSQDYKLHWDDTRGWMKILMQHLEPVQAYKIMMIHAARAKRE